MDADTEAVALARATQTCPTDAVTAVLEDPWLLDNQQVLRQLAAVGVATDGG